ncbi:hypothetical protein ACIOHC_35425 [Streptomyces sp. NPDC088252]|uniref:hypothetical protein n=1 Tax=unclassified Streptomyces TaxID=2593676 RepID=UPI003811C926
MPVISQIADGSGGATSEARSLRCGWNPETRMNFEQPTVRTAAGFDTFDLTVDRVIDSDPDLSRYEWKDVDEYAHVRRPGTGHQAVDDARPQALAVLAGCSGQFEAAAERRSWRWNPA